MAFPINNNNEESSLESIEHELYNPKSKLGLSELHRTKARRDIALPTSWSDEAPILTKGQEDKRISFGVKLFMVALLLLITAVGFSLWRVMSLRNVVSSNNIDMSVDVTPYVEGGEVVPLVVVLRNRNSAQLESANITLLYTRGNGSQDEQEKVQEKRDLGIIKQNEYKKQDFTVSLFGREGEERALTLKLEYKVAGSNAVFEKIVNTHTILRAPPVSVHIEGPDKLSVGQKGAYTVTIKNNSATTSPPSVLALILPINFTLDTTAPKPLARSTSWAIGTLPPGGTDTIVVSGAFDGKQNEVATIQGKIGSVGDAPTSIGIVYASETKDVTLRSSPLTLTMNLFSDNGGDEAIRYNDRSTLTITYNNTSLQALEDVSIVLSLSGDAPLYGTIDPTNGYYDSLQKTITWNKASLPDLAVLPPNAQGALRVVIPIVQKGSNSPSLKATLNGNASIKGADDVSTAVSKTWGVQGSATLTATTQYKTSPFPNSGPIPPEPNEDTTYTAHFSLSAQNTLSTTRVSFTLPAYVTWRGVTSDQTTIVYDSRTRTVTWEPGRLEQGKTVTADIGLLVRPSQSHVGQSPTITSGIILDADEEVSRAHLRTTLSPLTTSVHSELWEKNPSVVITK
jgi:hypothetical protein